MPSARMRSLVAALPRFVTSTKWSQAAITRARKAEPSSRLCEYRKTSKRLASRRSSNSAISIAVAWL